MNPLRSTLLAMGLAVTSCGLDAGSSAPAPDPVEAPASPGGQRPFAAASEGRSRRAAPVADRQATGGGEAPGGKAPTIRTTELRPAPIGAPAAPASASPATRVVVPAAGIDAALDALGVGSDGAVEPPADFDRAGWYTGSVQPGQPGPAVLAGHVDSKTGPAAFYGLAAVSAGDEVIVHRADGSTVTFRVTSVQQYAKEQLASEVVHGPVAGAELRLITCGGTFDRSSGHYRDNVVVFAVLA